MTGPAQAVVATDLRLVPPALAAWGAGLVVVHHPEVAVPAAPVAVGFLAATVVGLLLAAARHVRGRAAVCRPRGGGRPRSVLPTSSRPAVLPGTLPALSSRALPGVLLSAATAAVVLVSGAATHALHAPVAAAGTDAATVEVVGRVTAAPRPVGPDDPWVRWALTATALRSDGTWRRVQAPVDVVGPAGAATDARVRVRGTVVGASRDGRAVVRLRATQAPTVTAPPRPVHAWAARVRAGARTVAAPLPPDVRGLLPAVTVGDTADVPDDLTAAMRAAGLAHVTAVSGAHFAIVGALVLSVAAGLGAARPVRAGAVAAAGGALLLVVGPEPSVVRAAVMGAVGLVGLLAGRRAPGPAALSTAVVVLLVADPWLAVEVGFALSVAATAGLVLLGGHLVDRWAARCGRDVAALLAAPVAAQVGCLPVTLALWPTLGPWAVLANVAVVPAVAPATVLGLLAAVLAGPWPGVAALLAAGAGAACWWIAAVARWTAALPGAALAWWPGAGGTVAAVLVVVAVVALVVPGRRAA